MHRKMSISRWFCAAFAAALLCAPVALTKGNANIDEDLAAFIETFSECGRRYRLYEHDPEVLKDELSQLDFPDNWSAMVESLVVR